MRVAGILVIAAVVLAFAAAATVLLRPKPKQIPEGKADLSRCPDHYVAGVGGADEAPVLLQRIEPAFGDTRGMQGIIIIER